MKVEINLEEMAKRVAEGDFDLYLRRKFVGKNLNKTLSGYLNGVKKTIALLLYAASKDDRIRLTDATNDLYISRSSAHKLLRRKLIQQGYVEVVKEGKWMKYRLTEEGKKLALELAQILKKVEPQIKKEAERRRRESEYLELLRKRAMEIKKKSKMEPAVKISRNENEDNSEE